jgi:hypothetical protein
VGGRGTEHQNAQIRKIFSSFFDVGIFLGLWTSWRRCN